MRQTILGVSFALPVLLGLGLASCTPPPPPPAPSTTQTQDQIYTGTANNEYRVHGCNADHVAQTFTAGITGSLDKIALTLATQTPGPPTLSAPPQPIAISIQTVDINGAPTGIEIGAGASAGPSGVVAYPGVNWEIPLSGPAPVVAGTQYAIVVAESACLTLSDNGWYMVGTASASDAYPGGALWFQNFTGSVWTSWAQVAGPTTYDNFFTTWVTH
jgi:hypothetical protein